MILKKDVCVFVCVCLWYLSVCRCVGWFTFLCMLTKTSRGHQVSSITLPLPLKQGLFLTSGLMSQLSRKQANLSLSWGYRCFWETPGLLNGCCNQNSILPDYRAGSLNPWTTSPTLIFWFWLVCVLVSFLVAAIKYPNKASLAHMWQELEGMGHGTPVIRNKEQWMPAC